MAARARERIRERTSEGRPRPLTRPILLIFLSRVTRQQSGWPESGNSAQSAHASQEWLSAHCHSISLSALPSLSACCPRPRPRALSALVSRPCCVQRTNAGCGGRSLLYCMAVCRWRALLSVSPTHHARACRCRTKRRAAQRNTCTCEIDGCTRCS